VTQFCFWCGGWWRQDCEMCASCGMTSERLEAIKYGVHGQPTLSPIHSLFAFIGRLREPKRRPLFTAEKIDLRDDAQWNRILGVRQSK
jgi:hypothetical protein